MKAMSKPGEPNVPASTLLHQKSQAMIDDINRSYVKTSEYRMSYCQQPSPVRNEQVVALPTSEIPNFRRQALLTSQFPGRN